MIQVADCVICNGPLVRLKRALVAPFLATRIWNKSAFCVDLVQCRSCEFLFYNPRLEASEEALLYAGYRSPEYQQMRHASEPWYTPGFNADLAAPGYYDGRRKILASILREHAGTRQLRRILDYGGDRGDLVAGLLDGAEAFVYDISGVAPAGGVTSVIDPEACQADLVINSNVLEHVGFPLKLVEEMGRAVKPGGLLFLEVPCESPFHASRIARRVAQLGIMSLTRPALMKAVLRPAGLYMMHEHVNYFSVAAIEGLMRRGGCDVIASGRYMLSGRSGRGDMAWCLGNNR